MSRLAPVVHARLFRFEGHAHSPWKGSGRRKYSERTDAAGRVLVACGRALQEVHDEAERAGFFGPSAFTEIKSAKSRERGLVSCPECLKAILGGAK